jgi:hypothetical protein
MAVKSLKRSSVKSTQKTNAMNAGYSFQDFELIESVFVASTTASVTFNNLNQYATDYKHFQIRMVTTQTPFIRFNSDSGSNYSYHRLIGAPPSVESGHGINQNRIVMDYVGAGGNLGSAVMDILDPFITTKNTTTRYIGGRTAASRVAMESGLWRNTAAIVSISVIANDTSFPAGNRFSLYGIR